MVDLTAIDTPFGDLPRKVQTKLFKAWLDGKVIEFYGLQGLWGKVLGQPAWNSCTIYRVQPAPEATALTKPSIDWSHVAKGYDWLARDESGSIWLYNITPVQRGLYWYSGLAGSGYRVVTHASLTPGTCDWKDSLVSRPGITP